MTVAGGVEEAQASPATANEATQRHPNKLLTHVKEILPPLCDER
jgi:hypothetical protein